MFGFSFLYDPERVRSLSAFVFGESDRLPLATYFPGWEAAVTEATAICRQLIADCPGLLSIFQKLGKVERWSSFAERTRQDACEHSVTLAILAWLVAVNDPRIDVQRFVIRAFTHELGEGNTGDVEFPFKTSPILKYVYPIIEFRETKRILESFGEIGRRIFQIYSGGNKVEDLAFEMLERADYVLYALCEYFEHGRLAFIEPIARHSRVMKNRQADLSLGWTMIESSVEQLSPEIDRYITGRPDLLEQEPTRQDIIVLMEAALELLKEMEMRERA